MARLWWVPGQLGKGAYSGNCCNMDMAIDQATMRALMSTPRSTPLMNQRRKTHGHRNFPFRSTSTTRASSPARAGAALAVISTMYPSFVRTSHKPGSTLHVEGSTTRAFRSSRLAGGVVLIHGFSASFGRLPEVSVRDGPAPGRDSQAVPRLLRRPWICVLVHRWPCRKSLLHSRCRGTRTKRSRT